MNNRVTLTSLVRVSGVLLAALLAPGWSGWQAAQANATPIATLPIFSTVNPANEVKPNVLMVLDDSGSMDWDYMPDDASNFRGKYGFVSSQCNGMYYNPAITYSPPVDASGNAFSSSTFTSAPNDGFGTQATGSTNLSSSFKAYSSDTAQAAYYYKYSGTMTTAKQKDYYATTGIFYKECNSAFGSTTQVDGSHPVNSLFTKVTVSSTSGPGATDETTNFANWYTYYRTRMQMMKTATGRAFKPLDLHFRVGFMTINNNVSPAFLNVSDFDSTQKSNFYAKLYESNPNNSTPLREALSKAGRLFAGQLTTLNSATVVDPVQYSCQQNYTILSTDGFWNGTASSVKKIDGTTTMDNQDGALPRPYNDGSQVTTTIVTPYTSTQDRQAVTNINTVTNTWTRYTTTIGNNCTAGGPPSNTTSAFLLNNNHKIALGKASTDPDPNNGHCYSLGGNGWFCRGSSNNNPLVNQSSITLAGGTAWYLVSNIGTNTGCVSANAAWGSGYSTTVGACPETSVTGSLVTTTPQTQTETITGYSETSTDRFLATQTTTQVITNGVAGSIGALTPSPAVYAQDANLSFTSSLATDTCGGQAAPCPSSSGTWVNGTPNPNGVCTATASLPAAGTTTPVKTNTVNSGQTSTVTTSNQTGPTAGTPTSTSVGSGGVANTLADTAAYYYNTNLRTTALGNCTGPIIAPATTASDLCAANTVPPNGQDTATWQHMTTFTLGLGARGRMVFSPTYLTDTTGDYFDVLKGNTPTSTNCTWRDTLTVAGSTCNWPVPGADQIENVDDLWHAAVNGHGNYYSATDPAELANGLSASLNVIINTPRPGTASAAATTNPKITSTNNFQFSSYFKTVEWSGELIRQTMSLADGSVPFYDPTNPSPASYDWSAQTLLDAQSYTSRNIYTKGTSGLISFDWTSLVAAGLGTNFTAPNISTTPPAFPNQLTGLSQFCTSGNCLSVTAQNSANTTVASGGAAGEALVNFLRGDRSQEEGTVTDNSKFFRHRAHVLGDIVSAQPQYVGAPNKSLTDANYSAFVAAQSSRQAVVIAAANDGMLHSFNADTGAEMWAYIPSFALPRLYALADKNYGNLHQYFVEGTPVSGDICASAPASNCTATGSTAWKTIMVGGLNGGGTGYYALDITNPAAPALLWEFTDPNMGYTFGKPQITKLDDGTWVVLLTSGYNNCPHGASAAQLDCVKNGTGTGQGYLYVLNAGTGALITSISTGSGTTTSPSGLSQVVAHAPTNNVTSRVYGGDLNGNLWRFDISTLGTYGAQLLASFQDALGNAQPITARPQVTTINGLPVVYVGTGKYLGPNDVGSTLQQSFYAVKDSLVTPAISYGSPRLNGTFIKNTAVDTVCPTGTDVSICQPGQVVRTVGANTSGKTVVNMNGWMLDYPAGSGEINFTDSKLVLGTVSFTTSVPRVSTSQVCAAKNTTSEGDSFIYMLSFLDGNAVGTSSGVIGSSIGQGVATAPQIAQLPNGTVIVIVRKSGGDQANKNVPIDQKAGPAKRVSWRELVSP
jgi:type IV pilus assembly protein PilY1